LPLYYNDGSKIEEGKFLQTHEELIAQFGATSADTIIVKGRWCAALILARIFNEINRKIPSKLGASRQLPLTLSSY